MGVGAVKKWACFCSVLLPLGFSPLHGLSFPLDAKALCSMAERNSSMFRGLLQGSFRMHPVKFSDCSCLGQ